MEYLRLLVFITLCSSLCAERCKEAKPMDNFSVKKFSGEWYQTGFNHHETNLEIDLFEEAKCITFHLYFENGENYLNNWYLDLLLGDENADMEGQYYFPDSTKGRFLAFNPGRNITYDCAIMCSDYIVYATLYCCGNTVADRISEYVVLSLRNATKYDEIVSMKKLEKCYDGFITNPITEIKKRHSDEECSHIY